MANPTAEHTDAEVEKEKTEDRLLNDYSFYAASLLRIIDKKTNLVPLVRNTVQKIIAEIKQDIKARGRRIRMYILKGRQFGVTTDQLGENFHRTSTQFNKTALFIAHEPIARTALFDVVKRMHNHMPNDLPEWKPELKRSNKTELAFEGLDSAIRVGVAGEDNTGSGQTVNYLHLSELPKFPQNSTDDLLTSLFQAVPKSDPDSEIVGEGTANGVGGAFYVGFKAARFIYEGFLKSGVPAWRMRINDEADPENEWAAVFLPWYIHDEYEMDPEPGFKRTDYVHPVYGNEQELARIHGLNDQKLQWRRHTIVNECRGSLEKFHQEYPCTADEAFISSGSTVFNIVKCQEKIAKCKPPRAVYDCILETGQFTAKTLGPTDDANNLLQVWTEAQPGVAYIISADVSEGKEVGKSGKETDYHAADVAEQLTGLQVAHWHGKIEPVDFAVWLYHMGLRYNMAWLVPERNNHGTAVVGELARRKYKKLYFEESLNPPHRPILRYGWATVGGKYGDAKSLVIDNLSNLINKGADGIVCADTLREMITYKQSKTGKLGAEEGCFDDRVMSWAINCWVRGRLKLPSTAPGSAETQGPAMSGKGMF